MSQLIKAGFYEVNYLDKRAVLEILTDENICDTDEYGRVVIYCNDCREAGEILEIIKAELSNRWIPCSKVMPEDILPYNKKVNHPAINVLVTTKTGQVTKLQRIGDKGDDANNNLFWYWGRIYSDVVAWQPLPEKYVEEVKC